MTIELYCLIGAVILLLVHVSVQSFALKAQVGNAATVGARDHLPNATMLAGRAERALRNFNETFPAFAALALLVGLGGYSNSVTAWSAGLYLGFRVLYLPLYLAGVPWLRTFCWNIATAAIVGLIVGLFV